MRVVALSRMGACATLAKLVRRLQIADLMANVDPVVDPSPGTIWNGFAPTNFAAIAFDALASNYVT